MRKIGCRFLLALFLLILAEGFNTAKVSAQTEESGYIENFYLLGPFKMDSVDVKVVDDERDLSPSITNAGEEKWRIYNFTDRRLNLHEVFGYKDNIYGYAYLEVVSPEDKFVKLLVGSDDGIKIWVNGRNVLNNPVARALHIDEDKVNVQLKSGVNKILFKVVNFYGGYEFCARLTAQDGKDLKDLSYNPKNIYLKRLVPAKIIGSSLQQGKWDLYNPLFAIDDDLSTRWASDFYDPQYLLLDFGKIVSIRRVSKIWESANAKSFKVEVSNDDTNWKTI